MFKTLIVLNVFTCFKQCFKNVENYRSKQLPVSLELPNVYFLEFPFFILSPKLGELAATLEKLSSSSAVFFKRVF